MIKVSTWWGIIHRFVSIELSIKLCVVYSFYLFHMVNVHIVQNVENIHNHSHNWTPSTIKSCSPYLIFGFSVMLCTILSNMNQFWLNYEVGNYIFYTKYFKPSSANYQHLNSQIAYLWNRASFRDQHVRIYGLSTKRSLDLKSTWVSLTVPKILSGKQAALLPSRRNAMSTTRFFACMIRSWNKVHG